MIIEANSVTYSYPVYEQEAHDAVLDNVNLSVKKGEFVVVVGHNGSGKSTLAKLLNAILQPDTGIITVKGMDTLDEDLIWEIRQSCGMVFQNPDNQIVAGIVEEDVAFGPENLGIEPSEIRRRVDEALNAVNMTKYVKKAPHMLSGGQKQRVAIAGILAIKPDIIVLDEPTAMLDPEGREEVMHTVNMLNKEEGITIVHITHNMEEALLADRVIVMNDGHIVFEGLPEEVFSDVERIRSFGLDVPPIAELLYMLRQKGIELKNAFTPEAMAEELCQLL
jgi:energy-coupling factor transport system ATP-binding protein